MTGAKTLGRVTGGGKSTARVRTRLVEFELLAQDVHLVQSRAPLAVSPLTGRRGRPRGARCRLARLWAIEELIVLRYRLLKACAEMIILKLELARPGVQPTHLLLRDRQPCLKRVPVPEHIVGALREPLHLCLPLGGLLGGC